MKYKTLVDIPKEVFMDGELLKVFQNLFEWANKKGLEGKKVSNLEFISPAEDENITFSSSFICIVEENEIG